MPREQKAPRRGPAYRLLRFAWLVVPGVVFLVSLPRDGLGQEGHEAHHPPAAPAGAGSQPGMAPSPAAAAPDSAGGMAGMGSKPAPAAAAPDGAGGMAGMGPPTAAAAPGGTGNMPPPGAAAAAPGSPEGMAGMPPVPFAPGPAGAAGAPGFSPPTGPPGMAGGMAAMMGQMMTPAAAAKTPMYSSLMTLPALTPEKRAEIDALATQQIIEGTARLATGSEALDRARQASDSAAMQQSIGLMREGLDELEAGAAARRVLSEGKAPRNLALDWFKREMNLATPLPRDEPRTLLGVTPFHLFTMALLIAFTLAMVAMYFFKMRRAAALFGRLEGGSGRPPPGSSPPLAGAPAPATPATPAVPPAGGPPAAQTSPNPPAADRAPSGAETAPAVPRETPPPSGASPDSAQPESKPRKRSHHKGET